MTKNLGFRSVIVASVTFLAAASAQAQSYRELAAAPSEASGVELFVVDGDDAVEQRALNMTSGTASDTPSGEKLGGTASEVAALELAGGRHEVFIVDHDQALWHNRQPADSQDWTGWEQLDNATKHVSVARAANGRVELFTLGDDDALWHIGRDSDDAGFAGWNKVELQGSQLAAAAADGDGFLVAVIGDDRSLWLLRFSSSGELSGDPQNLGGESFDVALARFATGGHSLITVGTSNDLYEARKQHDEQADQRFGGWNYLGRAAPRIALSAAGEGLELFTLSDNGEPSRAQLTAADADWSEPSAISSEAQPLASQLQGRARLIIPSLNVDKDVEITIDLRFSPDRKRADITAFPPVVTEPFDTPFGTTSSRVSLAASSTGALDRDTGRLQLPVTLHFDQSLDLPIVQEDGDLSVDLSSDDPDGRALDPSSGEVTLSGKGRFQGQGSPNPLDGQDAQIIVTGKLTATP